MRVDLGPFNVSVIWKGDAAACDLALSGECVRVSCKDPHSKAYFDLFFSLASLSLQS